MTSFLFRIWAGPANVADFGRIFQNAGLRVVIHGTEHIYVLRDSHVGAAEAGDAVQSMLNRTGLAFRPDVVLWATLSDDAAEQLRSHKPW